MIIADEVFIFLSAIDYDVFTDRVSSERLLIYNITDIFLVTEHIGDGICTPFVFSSKRFHMFAF